MPTVCIHHPQGPLDVAYTVMGRGPRVLLVHGMGGSLRTLAPLQRALSPDHEVFAVDLPGFGRSGLPPRAQSLADLRESLCALVGPLLPGPAHLFGHSFGGLVAALAAVERPHLWRSLALASAAGFSESPRAFPDIRMPRVAKRALVLWMTSGRRGERLLSSVALHPQRIDRAMRRVLQLSYRQAREMLRLGPEPWPADLAQRVAQLPLPVLGIWGSADRTFPLAAVRRFAPDLPIHVIPGADHLVPIEAPSAVASALRALYAGVPSA